MDHRTADRTRADRCGMDRSSRAPRRESEALPAPGCRLRQGRPTTGRLTMGSWNRCSRTAPRNRAPRNWAWNGPRGSASGRRFATKAIGDRTHPTILRLQGLDALGHVAIIDVAAVDFHEVLECQGFVPGSLMGGSELVIQSGAGFLINSNHAQSLFVPADRGLGYAFVEEALRQPSVGLHDLGERVSAVYRLAGFL